MKDREPMLPGLVGAAIVWSAAYTVAFLALAAVVWILRPQDFGPGEGPAVIARTGLGVGFVSGAIFGAMQALFRSLAPRHGLPLWGAAIAGALAAAVWPLLTHVHDSMVMVLCPLGAACALATVGIARRFRRGAAQTT